jgi:signal transduction histidine kinase
VVDVSSTHRRKDGTAYPVAAHIQLLAFGGKPAYIAIIIDTTERVRALEEREHLLAHLQHSQRLESIGTLASGVAHEINNPLMGMMNYAELAKDTAKNPKEIEYLQEIGNEGNRIAGIVHSLLSFSRQDKGEFQLSSIGEIIDESLKLIGSLLRKNMIVLDLNISDSLPLISGRKQQLQQVVINLITNSVDALNQRYPESDDNKILRISASVLPEQPADSVRVSVEDHGAGISEDKILRIFDPFFTTKDRAKGTGLGLSVSFGIVREHNGQLNVTSKVGEFTRFDIDLPINGEGQDSKGSHSCRPEDLAKPTQ